MVNIFDKMAMIFIPENTKYLTIHIVKIRF